MAAAHSRRVLMIRAVRAELPMDFFRRIFARFRSWQADRRRVRRWIVPQFVSFAPPIHREVTANGVRVFSLCATCGVRLQASATLCEDCAQKKSRHTGPF
jgi:hypothetical protein